jgi:hypothetical protein
MKYILIPEDRIIDFLNLLDSDDEPITLQFYVSNNMPFYKIGLQGVLAEEGFLDFVKGIEFFDEEFSQ